MSKICCGVTYSDEDKVCRVCGKSLEDDEEKTVLINTTPDFVKADEDEPSDSTEELKGTAEPVMPQEPEGEETEKQEGDSTSEGEAKPEESVSAEEPAKAEEVEKQESEEDDEPSTSILTADMMGPIKHPENEVNGQNPNMVKPMGQPPISPMGPQGQPMMGQPPIPPMGPQGQPMMGPALTLTLFALLAAGPMDGFTAVCYAFSTMSTGGFATTDAGLELWDSDYAMVVVMAFMFLGGVSFTLLYRLVHGEFRKLWANDVFRYYLGIIGVFYVLFVIAIIRAGHPLTLRTLAIEPLFQIISFISSTGYTVPTFPTWGTFVLAMVFILLFFGACAGSTSGGAKIDRLIYLLKNCRNEIMRTIYPNNILTVRVNGHVIPHDIIAKVVAFLCLYVLIIVVGGIVLCGMRVPLIDAFFTAFTCISNTGLPTGITGYGQNFGIIPDAGKWVLAIIMLIGRLELFTVLILFSPSFWRK